jgi:hypothetical protein
MRVVVYKLDTFCLRFFSFQKLLKMSISKVSQHEPEALFSQALKNAFNTYEHDSNKSLFRSIQTEFEGNEHLKQELEFIKALKALYMSYSYQTRYGDTDLHAVLSQTSILSQNQLVTV